MLRGKLSPSGGCLHCQLPSGQEVDIHCDVELKDQQQLQSSHIDDFISKCSECQKHQPQQGTEPLIPHEIPITPWTKLGMDLFELDGMQYLLMVDYHSKFPVAQRLTTTSSANVANTAATVLGLLGAPTEIFSDNGPQFVGATFQKMCREWGIQHITSSPRYPQSNGSMERIVRTVKSIIKKTTATKQSTAAALLNYRCTSIDSTLPSPAELMFGRQVRSSLSANLDSNTTYKGQKNQERLEQRRSRMKEDFDSSGRRVQKLDYLRIGQKVRVLDQGSHIWIPAEVTDVCDARSYVVTTPNGNKLRRNRVHLRDIPQMPLLTSLDDPEQSQGAASQIKVGEEFPPRQPHSPNGSYITRSGRISKEPAR
ncbi:uncharacterized protein [Diadema setosum]|uniref:uncharacterized protein n=1 Tax=Diadema setosum TaxID=31175 RepID=UPI003B3B402E